MPISPEIWGRGVPISRGSPYRSYTGNDVNSEVNSEGDLKACVNNQSVTSVEFVVAKEAEPGLSLELDCGKTVWTPVSVKRPSVTAIRSPDGSKVLSVHELTSMDEVVFKSQMKVWLYTDVD